MLCFSCAKHCAARRLYAEKRKFKKKRQSDTWKGIVVLCYLGSYKVDNKECLLSGAAWELIMGPRKLSITTKNKTRRLTEKEYSKILFRDTVKIIIPNFCDDKNSKYVKTTAITLEPNTPAGSTLKYAIEKLYITMLGIKSMEIYHNEEDNMELLLQRGYLTTNNDHIFINSFSKLNNRFYRLNYSLQYN